MRAVDLDQMVLWFFCHGRVQSIYESKEFLRYEKELTYTPEQPLSPNIAYMRVIRKPFT